MKPYNLTSQENNNWCILSCLQSILQYDKRLNIPQTNIAKELTQDKNGFKIEDEKIKYFMNSRGFSYEWFWYNETPLNEPDSLLWEMRKEHGIIGLNNHTFLLKEFQDPVLTLIDPKDCMQSDKNLFALLREMQSVGGGFGLIKKL